MPSPVVIVRRRLAAAVLRTCSDNRTISFSSSTRACCSLSESFFFQAEDGIRDIGVTGVQTCALPILPQRKIRINVALEPTQQFDSAGLYPFATRSPAALVHHCLQPVMLHPPTNSSHLARFDSNNLSRLDPAQPLGDSFGDNFAPGHCSRFPPHLPLDLLHRAALPQ